MVGQVGRRAAHRPKGSAGMRDAARGVAGPYHRDVRRALAFLVLGLSLAIGACSSSPPGVPVATYVRNAATTDVSLIVRPVPAAATSILVAGGQQGADCDTIAAGSQLLLTGGKPTAQEPDGDRLVALIGSQDPGSLRSVWVDVAADGTVTTGTGVPTWWTGEQVTC
jgi:hypothetical protein